MNLDLAPGDAFGGNSSENDPINAGNPSSGFGIGSSSNQSYTNMININDLVDDFVQDQDIRQGRPRKPCFLFRIVDSQDLGSES